MTGRRQRGPRQLAGSPPHAGGANGSGRERGVALGSMAKLERPALSASDQPFLWVETDGTVRSTATIFMLSPPPI